MTMSEAGMFFDDARLDDQDVLASHDGQLRWLAGAGARIRIEADGVQADGLAVDEHFRPRGVVVIGAEARLIRAVLERICPVPLVAWGFAGLPGWVGPLDLVVVLASRDDSTQLTSSVDEATRRGASLVVACPSDSRLASRLPSTAARVNTRTADPTAAAIVVLQLLHQFGLGPRVSAQTAADAADLVAEESSPHRDLATNPAKHLALSLADAEPLIWGGSVLAARASRRIAEAIRVASGRPALAAEAEDLLPVLTACPRRDLFADPFDQTLAARPVLVTLEGPSADEQVLAARRELVAIADDRDVRVCPIHAEHDNDIDRYVSLLLKGSYAATYLGIGLTQD